MGKAPAAKRALTRWRPESWDSRSGRQLGGEPVVFLHYPPITQQNRCEELISVIREFGCRRVYYGHIHGSSGVAWAINGEVDGVTYRLVSCDSVGFTPVLVQQS